MKFREGLSVHAETARSVDPAISETETRPPRSKKRSRARLRKIEGRSMTLIELFGALDRGPTGDFSAHRDAGLRHRFFLLLR